LKVAIRETMQISNLHSHQNNRHSVPIRNLITALYQNPNQEKMRNSHHMHQKQSRKRTESPPLWSHQAMRVSVAWFTAWWGEMHSQARLWKYQHWKRTKNAMAIIGRSNRYADQCNQALFLSSLLRRAEALQLRIFWASINISEIIQPHCINLCCKVSQFCRLNRINETFGWETVQNFGHVWGTARFNSCFWLWY